MIRSFKYPLEPNRHQSSILKRWLEYCRVLYNVALEQRREWYRMGKISLSYNDQCKELTELRAADSIWKDVPVEIERSALKTLQRAFDGFFRRIKRGETPGYPRFKGRGRFDSFGVGRVSVEGKKTRIPKLGLIKFRKYRELCGAIRDARIVLRAGKWYVVFSCDIGKAPEKKSIRNAVGIDVGLYSFATLSNGQKIQNPRFFRNGEELLVRRQRAITLKARGSKGRDKAKLLIQKAHEHIRNQRLDFSYKLSAELFRLYDCVFYEDLNIRRLAKSKLSKSIHDAAWGIFTRTLTCKAECAGKWAISVNPSGTSARCSNCGFSISKNLSERTHRCPVCHLEMDRDENAARNILALGRSAAVVFSQSPS